ncbi:OLC1v1010854C1 [Oldenlandia corymbosa var. corymbosa]|uniref:OLC1v1010854C1 n=1 Tax=Oldenlandia corymbosa var. corymbosa TaxID=529605 RepID=A0AAV1DS88_OLDCO|nr:OLC1v1010854C1 [Oldenlandia corymbosa var. corymbosa]
MVNLVEIQKPLMHGLMKMAGIVPHSVQIEKGTTMNIWVPIETIPKPKKPSKKTTTSNINDYNNTNLDDHHLIIKPKPEKPVVVLVHGFAAEGIVTWQFQIGALTKKYSVYVPDLLFFGGSITESSDRSPTFQAECLVKGLRLLGIDKCVVVGFSYGGMVAFKMAEMYPELVQGLVISGSILAMTDSISTTTLNSLGFSSSSELLLPDSVKGLKALLKVAVYKKLWFPDRLHKDFLEVMFNNRKERAELLEALVVSNKEATIPHFSQKIHLLWGADDQIFNLELAQNMKEQLGDNATFQSIEKAGHLVHLERPCVYNKCLKKLLSSLVADEPQN